MICWWNGVLLVWLDPHSFQNYVCLEQINDSISCPSDSLLQYISYFDWVTLLQNAVRMALYQGAKIRKFTLVNGILEDSWMWFVPKNVQLHYHHCIIYHHHCIAVSSSSMTQFSNCKEYFFFSQTHSIKYLAKCFPCFRNIWLTSRFVNYSECTKDSLVSHLNDIATYALYKKKVQPQISIKGNSRLSSVHLNNWIETSTFIWFDSFLMSCFK